MGKTRLAVEHLRSRDDAVVFARLEQVDREGDVAAAVAAALGVREIGTAQLLDVVLDCIPDGVTVLLDNAEHVRAQAAALVSAIVAQRADVTVLVTTQSPLGVPGERVLRVAPLPQGEAIDVATAAAAPAARLVLDRAALVRPELSAPDDADRAAAIRSPESSTACRWRSSSRRRAPAC